MVNRHDLVHDVYFPGQGQAAAYLAPQQRHIRHGPVRLGTDLPGMFGRRNTDFFDAYRMIRVEGYE